MENIILYLRLAAGYYLYSLVFLAAFLGCLWWKKAVSNRIELFFCLGAYISLTFILGLTVGSSDFEHLTSNGFRQSLENVNLIPVVGLITAFFTAPMNFWGNIALFLPAGFFCGAFFLASRRETLKVLVFGALFSLTVELFQIVGLRAFDINDILLNTLGVVLGFAILRVMKIYEWKPVGRLNLSTQRGKAIFIVLDVLALLSLVSFILIKTGWL